jgi:hypothetical protein
MPDNVDDSDLGESILNTDGEFRGRDHDAILQTLNRKVGGRKLTVKPFESTVAAWANVPIIFGKNHPNMTAYNLDPESELNRISGRVIVGSVKSPRIEVAGKPRLLGRISIGDEYVNTLVDEGKLSLSTGFWCPTDSSGQTIGTVTPHHVLLFEETDSDLPADLGTGILNKEGVNMAENAAETEMVDSKTFLEKMEALFAKYFAGSDTPGNQPDSAIANKDDTMTDVTEIEAKLAAKEVEFTNMAKELADAKAALAEVNKATVEAKWTEILNKKVVGGLKDTPEKIAELRELYDNDKDAFYNKVMESMPDGTETGREGSAFANKDAKTSEHILAGRELDAARGV